MDQRPNQGNDTAIRPAITWPREVVVEHGDGTVSLYSGSAHSGCMIRGRRAGDIVREDDR